MRAPYPVLTKILFAVGILLCLAQIWLPFCFLTGDGPCHVYNAQILHDIWTNKNVSFYSFFLDQVKHANPNWTTHILLASLMFFVSGIVAEKVLLSVYLILFAFGFARLLKKLGVNDLLTLPVFLFAINHILLKGFYNFSLGIAVWFWLLVIWIQYLEVHKRYLLLPLFLLSLGLFFTHPLAFAFGLATCGVLTLSFSFAAKPDFARGVKLFVTDALFLLLCFLPGLLLFLKFAGTEPSAPFHLHPQRYRIKDLLYNVNLIDYTIKEELPAKIAAILIGLLAIVAMVNRVRMGFKVQRYDGLILISAITLFVYLCFPDTMLGGSLLTLRTRFLLYLLLICSGAAFLTSDKLKAAGGIVFFAFFLLCTVIRMPVILAAAKTTEDNISAIDSIKPYSTVLPLNFYKNGKDIQGKTIADANWLFCHQEQYMGTKKPLIFLDNYEANTGYFPLVWREKVNPYYHLGKNGSFEDMPPSADIPGYWGKTGVRIDYVIFFCFDSSYLSDPACNKLYQDIKSAYHIVYRSPSTRTVLFAKN